MAITIISESYGPRKPFITCEADSLDELAALECAEGSTATVGGTEYTLDRVNGWIVPGGGGGEGGGAFIIDCTVSYEGEDEEGVYAIDKTLEEINAAYNAGQALLLKLTNVYDGVRTGETDWYYLSYAADSYYQFQGPIDLDNISYQYISISDEDGLYIEQGSNTVSDLELPPKVSITAAGTGDWASNMTLTWQSLDPNFLPDNPGLYFQNLIANGARAITVRAVRDAGGRNQYWDFPMIKCTPSGVEFGRFECNDVGDLLYCGIYVSAGLTYSIRRSIISAQ